MLDPKDITAGRIRRTEAYAEKVRKMFAGTVSEILALRKGLPKLDEGVMYSFDAESEKIASQVELLLRRLHSSTVMAIRGGIEVEWEQANAECDEIVKTYFGKKALSDPRFNAVTNRNKSAMEAFIERSERDLSLSDRVWNPVRQLRDEMEVAMTVAIGEGQSASQMSRKVRQYLNDPDLMFRRFRYKDENGEWKRKWKKRIKDEKTGRFKWIDYDKSSYKDKWTGRGYYKSSAKNAMRVTRTETNIAYRRADHERWRQMDFVLGQKVQLSKNHPCRDICDILSAPAGSKEQSGQGCYPKDFVFDGWHPQCYSDDSEVLTADGWKLFADVQDNDRILSLNPDTRDIEYVGIIDKQRYERKGEMIRFYNRSLDCLVTPEHQMVYLNKADGRIERCRADEFRNTKGAFYRGCLYSDKMERASIKIGSDEIAFDDYCEFIGYWLADGSLERNSGVAVAQKKGQLLRSDIADCIARMGYIPRFRKHTIMFYNSDFNAFLKRFGHARDKYIPSDILNASKRQISIFLNAFIQCDGSVRRCKSFIGSRGSLFHSAKQQRVYFTTSPIMAANIGELLLKIGKRPSYNLQKASVSVKKDGTKIKGNYDCWRISECGSVTATVFKKETVPYDGYVYDLSLERNHIMYIRRNGKCFWGSNCFCFVTPILVSEDEIAKMNAAFLRGEEYAPKGKMISEYPDSFKDWVVGNKENIKIARDRGTEPYFIRNNASAIDEILNPKPKELTTLEKAKLRHDARTPEQIADIKARAAARQKRLSEERATRKYGERIKRYMDGISDVDTSALDKALQAGDTSAIMAEAQNLKSIGKKILALSHLDNPMQVARTYSMADAIAVNNAVDARIAKEITRIGSDLHRLKSFLESEIKWVEDHKKYATWKAAQDAYKKELLIVDNKIAIKDIADSVDDALAFSTTTRSKVMKELAGEMKAMLSSSRVDIAAARAKAKELNNKYNQLKSKSAKVAKIGKVTAVKGETIDEMKKRLGSKMPRTLENLEKAISNYEKTSRYGDVAKNHKAEIEELMRKLFDEHDLGMNIDDDILEAVLNSWFKNTFETGSSGGYLGSRSTSGKISTSHGRLEAAHRLFGLSKDLDKGQLSRHEYEKYGNLLDHDIAKSMAHNTATQYGNVEVRFKKDKVIATWTAGDSLGERYQPSLVSDPRSCSFDDLHKTPTSASIQVKDLAKFKRDHISSYLELQYHGDLTIDCVESLTFPYDLNKSSRSKYLAIARKWKAAGAKIYYIDDNGDLKQL